MAETDRRGRGTWAPARKERGLVGRSTWRHVWKLARSAAREDVSGPGDGPRACVSVKPDSHFERVRASLRERIDDRLRQTPHVHFARVEHNHLILG